MLHALVITTIIASGLVAWFGTLLVERLAPRLGLVKPPNERSSHTRPTPRGGGVAIAIAVVASGVVLAMLGNTSLWAPIGLTLLIAMLGFSDDLMDLSPALRFPVQGLVFALLIYSAGPLPPLQLGIAGWSLDGLLLAIIIGLVGVWWLNLFNFMDGIDGIAATHAILVLAGALLVWQTTNADAWQFPGFWLALCVIAATGGFLLRNWPPARIFMGDAGSNSLALVIFFIALETIRMGAIGYATWLILPAAFVADATVALVWRSLRGERPWRAHRRHAYQQLSRLWGHRRVTLIYCAMTAFWCLPLALAGVVWPSLAWPAVFLTYLPILGFVIWGRSGAADELGAQRCWRDHDSPEAG